MEKFQIINFNDFECKILMIANFFNFLNNKLNFNTYYNNYNIDVRKSNTS